MGNMTPVPHQCGILVKSWDPQAHCWFECSLPRFLGGQPRERYALWASVSLYVKWVLIIQLVRLLQGLSDITIAWHLKECLAYSKSSINVSRYCDLASGMEMDMLRRARKGFQERFNESPGERHGPDTDQTSQEKLCEMLGTAHPEDKWFLSRRHLLTPCLPRK